MFRKTFIAMGNVDPAGEFRNGTAESVYNRTKRSHGRVL